MDTAEDLLEHEKQEKLEEREREQDPDIAEKNLIEQEALKHAQNHPPHSNSHQLAPSESQQHHPRSSRSPSATRTNTLAKTSTSPKLKEHSHESSQRSPRHHSNEGAPEKSPMEMDTTN